MRAPPGHCRHTLMSEAVPPSARRALPLEGVVQHYAWGSPTAIPLLLGRENPDGRPWAELWLGAHPKAPSRVEWEGEERPLDELIKAHPVALLGERVARSFGPTLPFLLKVLAAKQPLSIQAHPDRAQARAGFAREEAAGIPLDAPERSYRDPNPKPELIVALTPFIALKGFRETGEILDRISRAGVEELAAERALLASDPGQDGLRRFVGELLELSDSRRAIAISQASESGLDPLIQRLATSFPGDVGALAPLFLQHVELAPSEGLFLKPRELHTYIDGVGLELMANSDNVLRGGLTKKHIERSELLSVLSFEHEPVHVLRSAGDPSGAARWPTPAREFYLDVIDNQAGQVWESPGERGVELLFAGEGQGRVICGSGEELALPAGRAALVPAAAGAYRLAGEGLFFRVSVPEELARA